MRLEGSPGRGGEPMRFPHPARRAVQPEAALAAPQQCSSEHRVGRDVRFHQPQLTAEFSVRQCGSDGEVSAALVTASAQDVETLASRCIPLRRGRRGPRRRAAQLEHPEPSSSATAGGTSTRWLAPSTTSSPARACRVRGSYYLHTPCRALSAAARSSGGPTRRGRRRPP